MALRIPDNGESILTGFSYPAAVLPSDGQKIHCHTFYYDKPLSIATSHSLPVYKTIAVCQSRLSETDDPHLWSAQNNLCFSPVTEAPDILVQVHPHTRHTKLTSQAGTTRATRFYGARHGRIFQTPTLNAPDTRSVSTTAATPSAALTSCPPSTWA